MSILKIFSKQNFQSDLMENNVVEPDSLPLTKWDGKGSNPLTVEEYLEPQLHPDKAYKEIVSHTRSFADLLAPRIDLKNGKICLQDFSSVGRMFNVKVSNTEARTDESMNTLNAKIMHAISSVLPLHQNNPWILQWFIQDDSKAYFPALIKQIKDYMSESSMDSSYSKFWLAQLEQHFKDIAQSNGLFQDPNLINSCWRGRNRQVRLCIWRISNQKRGNEYDNIDQVCEQLVATFAQAEVKLIPSEASELYEWLTYWFVPQPDSESDHKNTQELLEQNPWRYTELDNSLSLVSESARADLGRAALHGVAPWTWKKPGIWWFRGKPSRFLSMDELTGEPEIGHLTAERRFGDSSGTLWDQMPENSIWSMTIVYSAQDEIREKISKVSKNSVGDEASALERRKLASVALGELARGNPIFRVFCGAFLFGDNLADLDRKTESVLSFLSANHIRLVAPRYDPISLDSYIRALPFGFDPVQDQQLFARRSRLWYASHISRFAPAYGRSRGSGYPGMLLYNRGAEPLTFDPLNSSDRAKNAHALILGPTGSGKTAFLVYSLLHAISIHRPRIYLITALPTFGLFADHCEHYGLNVHRVIVDGKSSISIPPFAYAQVLLSQEMPEFADFTYKTDSESSHVVRDPLGEMELQARLMITGGQRNEEKKLRRDDLNIIRFAILEAAKNSKLENRSQTLTSDVVSALLQIAERKEIGGKRFTKDQSIHAGRMASAMNLFCTGLNGKFFNREGKLWPSADITLVELDLFARKGYEDRLAVALTGLFATINNQVEAEQFQERQTIVVIDEAHILLQNPLVSPYINRISATWRTFGAWLWTATQNLRQLPEDAKEFLNQPEWWFCLSVDKDEISQISRFRSLTSEQEELLLSARKAPGFYTEGSVISTNLTSLFRNVPPAVALALSQTEKNEKAQRAKLMEKHGWSELEAAYQIAEDIRMSRLHAT